MNAWLVKSEPDAYSFAQFQKEKRTLWTGVRSFAARNFLRAMAKGDPIFFYHSQVGKEIVGLGAVLGPSEPDPTVAPDEKGEWVAVPLKAGRALPRAVTLAQIKQTPALAEMVLLKQSRLSVSPIRPAEAKLLRKLGGLVAE